MEEKIGEVIWHQEEPISATNVLSHYLVLKKAKEKGIKVMLSGQGADEILGGYNACFKPFGKTYWQPTPYGCYMKLGDLPIIILYRILTLGNILNPKKQKVIKYGCTKNSNPFPIILF